MLLSDGGHASVGEGGKAGTPGGSEPPPPRDICSLRVRTGSGGRALAVAIQVPIPILIVIVLSRCALAVGFRWQRRPVIGWRAVRAGVGHAPDNEAGIREPAEVCNER